MVLSPDASPSGVIKFATALWCRVDFSESGPDKELVASDFHVSVQPNVFNGTLLLDMIEFSELMRSRSSHGTVAIVITLMLSLLV